MATDGRQCSGNKNKIAHFMAGMNQTAILGHRREVGDIGRMGG